MMRTMRSAIQSETPNQAQPAWKAGGARRGNRTLAVLIGAGLALAIVFGLGSSARAQSPTPPGQNNGGSGMDGSGRGGGFGRPNMGSFTQDDGNYDPMMAERRLRALNIERQKQMVSDAAKLLKLAQELNTEVAAANSGAFTPDQLRKIGEIEKLARNVRERMTTAVGETPSVLPPPNLMYPVH
jgi:hypothetical protein